MKFSVVTEASTFLIITQVSSGLKKPHILIFSKCGKYLHVKMASSATENPVSCMALCNHCELALDLSICTVDTSIVFSFHLGCNVDSNTYRIAPNGVYVL